MDRSNVFHSGIEQQEAFFSKLQSLVKPHPKPQVRAKPRIVKTQPLGIVIPLKTQGCYLLVKKA